MPRRKRTPAENRAVYARRQARARAAGTTVYGRRQARARAEGWDSESQRRYWRRRLRDSSFVRELGEEIGGPVEPWRPGSLLSVAANEIVNPRDQPRRPGDWRIRLLRAAGRI